MKKITKAMYGKSMMKTGGAKKMQGGGMSTGQVDRMNTNTTEGEKQKMKTGGMVNSNAKVPVDKTPGSKGVKSGTNPKASASKKAKGKVGGTSVAPKTATPKAMYGMSMKPGMMKMGGAKKK